MPKSRTQKEQTVKDLVEAVKKAKMIVLADFKGLKVKQVTALRQELNKAQVECLVVKKTLMNRAFKDAGVDFDAKSLPGNIIGVNLGFGEQIAPAKIVVTFNKAHEAMKILGGFLENKFIDATTVKVFATLPSREELLARVVGSIASPMRGLVTVLSGNLRGLVQVLNAYKEKQSTTS